MIEFLLKAKQNCKIGCFLDRTCFPFTFQLFQLKKNESIEIQFNISKRIKYFSKYFKHFYAIFLFYQNDFIIDSSIVECSQGNDGEVYGFSYKITKNTYSDKFSDDDYFDRKAIMENRKIEYFKVNDDGFLDLKGMFTDRSPTPAFFTIDSSYKTEKMDKIVESYENRITEYTDEIDRFGKALCLMCYENYKYLPDHINVKEKIPDFSSLLFDKIGIGDCEDFVASAILIANMMINNRGCKFGFTVIKQTLEPCASLHIMLSLIPEKQFKNGKWINYKKNGKIYLFETTQKIFPMILKKWFVSQVFIDKNAYRITNLKDYENGDFDIVDFTSTDINYNRLAESDSRFFLIPDQFQTFKITNIKF